MGKYLDLNDVAHGHPVAERELRALLDFARRVSESTVSMPQMMRDEAIRLAALRADAQEQNNEEPSVKDTASRDAEHCDALRLAPGGSSPSIHDFIAACVFAHAHKVVDAIAVEMHARAAQEALRRHDTPAPEAEDDAAVVERVARAFLWGVDKFRVMRRPYPQAEEDALRAELTRLAAIRAAKEEQR